MTKAIMKDYYCCSKIIIECIRLFYCVKKKKTEFYGHFVFLVKWWINKIHSFSPLYFLFLLFLRPRLKKSKKKTGN